MRLGIILVIAIAVFGAGCKSGEAAKPTNVTFTTVSALLAQRCINCHGATGRPKGGIDLRTYDSIMKGGKEGPIVSPGSPDGSVIIDALRGRNGKKKMPFRSTELTEQEIENIEAWIREGAKK